jgi:hypothetical protein
MTEQPKPRTSRWRGLFPALVVGLAFLAASAVTWRTSSALFTATTTNGADTFATGSVALSDNDSGAALFTVSNLKPGDSAAKCIRVTYTGTLASGVRVYGTGLTVSGGSLDQWLNLQIEQGTNSLSTAGTCGTFTGATTIFANAAFNTFGTNYAGGSGSWTPSSNPTVMDYRITYTLSSSAPNGTMAQNLSLTFTWEAQNT